jgi:iron complex transport system ATP-binding protein
MLEARSLAFGFRGRTIGRGIDLAVTQGEILCVLGPNGGGKTTLFRTLLGLLEPCEGEVLLDGRSLRDLSRVEVARIAGYVPQGHSAYFAFALRDFVLMGRTSRMGAFASPGDADRRVAERALESLGLSALGDRPVTELSGGERQLGLVARALAQEPRLLVMDEPTASLDFGNRLRVLDRIAALAQTGISILFSSHDPDQALRVADRVLLFGEGRVLETGAPDAVIRPDTLAQLYGVPVEIFAKESA